MTPEREETTRKTSPFRYPTFPAIFYNQDWQRRSWAAHVVDEDQGAGPTPETEVAADIAVEAEAEAEAETETDATKPGVAVAVRTDTEECPRDAEAVAVLAHRPGVM